MTPTSPYPGFNPKAMEAWLTLMAEAMRGTHEAQQAMEAYAKMSGTAEEWRRWMERYVPAAQAPSSPEAMEAWVEEWQKMLGVVPRRHYLDVLEKNAELQRRLEEAEETISRLRGLQAGRAAQEETAQQVMDTWSKMLEETLRTQTEWMQRWQHPHSDEKPEKGEQDE